MKQKNSTNKSTDNKQGFKRKAGRSTKSNLGASNEVLC